ncbi:hypothetical protein HHUSO_G32724 [Huso huso]|uniref:Uncharacterized protein n=1 Tax=Huso huso TaxID=61971 RepID=A0ABR0YA41_HUSHU
MSRVPVGKVLLRNVIRHTDAHNKIQEESEMWKMREMEKQTPVIQQKWQPTKLAPDFGRFASFCSATMCKMRSDSFHEETHSERRGAPAGHTSEQDRREAKHWTKKLYDFEAGDPNRWRLCVYLYIISHSGFRELYPEEFHTHSDSSNSDEKNDRKKKKTLQRSKASQQHTGKRKRSKKSNKKKQKRQSSKKRKRKKGEDSNSPSDQTSSDESDGEKRRARRKRKRTKKKKSSEGKEESSEDSDSDTSSSSESEPRDERKKRKRKRRRGESEQGSDGRKSKLKNWKLTTEEDEHS